MGGGSLLGRFSKPPRVLLASLSVIVLLALISSFAFFSTFFTSSAYADPNGSASATTDVVLNLTSAISIRTLDSTASSEIESLDLELTPTPSGRFVKDTTIVDVATSNTTGYMLYMASDYTNPHTSTSESPVYTTDMIHSDTNVASNYSIPTIDPTHGGTSASTTISEAEFSTANSSYKNRWGYSLTEKNVAGTYNAIPAHNSPDTINSTVSTAVEHSYTPVTVGVNVDTNIASGTYTNKLEFTAIANALPTVFTLSYAPNTGSGDTASNMPEPQTITTVSSQYTFTIPNTIPTTSQEGYVLKEWNTKPDGTGDSYQPGDAFTIIADSSLMDPGARTLYAIWEENNFWTITYMQDMTPEICASVKTPSNATGTNVNAVVLDTDGVSTVSGAKATYTVRNMADYNTLVTADNQPYVAQRTLYDIRDNKPYTIRRLADGACWMTSDLAFELQENTNYIGSKNDGTTFTFNTGVRSSGQENTILNINSVTSSVSHYYTWYAATAGMGDDSLPLYTRIDGSICPSGWMLPSSYLISTTDPSFGLYAMAYFGTSSSTSSGVSKLVSFPMDLTKAGYYYSGSYYDGRYYDMVYWSSVRSPRSAYTLETIVNHSTGALGTFYPDAYNYGYYGVPVRCVAI